LRRIQVRTSRSSEMVDITDEVQKAISQEGIREGVCCLFVPHTTAAITINEGADPSVCQDILDKLEQVIPRGDGYRHREGNAAAHIKASLVGSCVMVLLERGKLSLGTWQSVFFCEFDGPRQRQVWLVTAGSELPMAPRSL